jgi:membrane-bound toxin of toxin-antitoxin system
MRFHVGMRWPPPVRVSLARSTIASAAIAALALATSLIVATLPLDPLFVGLALIAIAAWAIDRVQVVGLRHGRRAVRSFELRGDLTLVVVSGDGTASAGRVRRDSYVGARLSTIVWRPYGRWRSRTILLLPDMLPAEEFRRLRVLLRYGRSDATHGEPASHA